MPRQLSAAECNGEHSLFLVFNEKQGNACLPPSVLPALVLVFYLFFLSSHSVCNKQVNISMQAHPPLWTCTDTQAPGHMHRFTCFPHADMSVQPHILYTHRPSLKVSTVKPILSVFLCALFPTVLVFFSPPATMCHHLPS